MEGLIGVRVKYEFIVYLVDLDTKKVIQMFKWEKYTQALIVNKEGRVTNPADPPVEFD